MAHFTAALWRDESGQDLIEYALLVAFVSVMAVAIPFQSILPVFNQLWTRILDALPTMS